MGIWTADRSGIDSPVSSGTASDGKKNGALMRMVEIAEKTSDGEWTVQSGKELVPIN